MGVDGVDPAPYLESRFPLRGRASLSNESRHQNPSGSKNLAVECYARHDFVGKPEAASSCPPFKLKGFGTVFFAAVPAVRNLFLLSGGEIFLSAEAAQGDVRVRSTSVVRALE